jgi:hypothetical protein
VRILVLGVAVGGMLAINGTVKIIEDGAAPLNEAATL